MNISIGDTIPASRFTDLAQGYPGIAIFSADNGDFEGAINADGSALITRKHDRDRSAADLLAYVDRLEAVGVRATQPHRCGPDGCVHASSCAIHNEPALPAGGCDCGLKTISGNQSGSRRG